MRSMLGPGFVVDDIAMTSGSIEILIIIAATAAFLRDTRTILGALGQVREQINRAVHLVFSTHGFSVNVSGTVDPSRAVLVSRDAAAEMAPPQTGQPVQPVQPVQPEQSWRTLAASSAGPPFALMGLVIFVLAGALVAVSIIALTN